MSNENVWYKVTAGKWPIIRRVIAVHETDNRITVGSSTDYKLGGQSRYFKTWQEAKDDLVKTLELKIQIMESQIDFQKQKLNIVKALTSPQLEEKELKNP